MRGLKNDNGDTSASGTSQKKGADRSVGVHDILLVDADAVADRAAYTGDMCEIDESLRRLS